MHNLLNFLAKYSYWFLFLVLEAISFVLLFQFNSYQGSVWFTSANAVSGKVYEQSAKVKSYFQLETINEELTKENLYLAHRLQLLNAQKEDSIADSLAHASALLQHLSPYKLIPAKIVHASLNKRDNLLTIDKGARDGVKRDMGVVCGTGVVGIVYLTSNHYSVVIPVLSDICRAFVDDIPRHAHFRLYENVVTSGYSSVFPAGIPVGKILHVYNSPDQMSYRLQLQLSTNFGTLRDVFVVDNSAFTEQIDILRAAEDSMRVKNGGEKQ